MTNNTSPEAREAAIEPCPFCLDPMKINISNMIQHVEQMDDCPIRAQAWPMERWLSAWNSRPQPPAYQPQEHAPDVVEARGKLTPEYLAMTPLQKWETLTLHGLIGTDEPWIADMRETLRNLSQQPPASEVEAREIHWVGQEGPLDCVAAAYAMLTNQTLDEAKAEFTWTQDEPGRYCVSELFLLWEQRGNSWKHTSAKDRERTGNALPGEINLALVKCHENSPLYHAVVVTSSGIVFDPATPSQKRLADYHHIGGVSAALRIQPDTTLVEAATDLIEYAKQGKGVTADLLNALQSALAAHWERQR